jgi:hypothetical protein
MQKNTDEHGFAGRYVSRIKIENHVFSGAIWFTGWLFTIGFLHLDFWRGVLAVVVWPFYLGDFVSRLLFLGNS